MAELGFEGKVAIITGAGGGLGRSHALELAKRGALVVVNDLGGSTDGTGDGSQPAAQKVVDEIKAAGGEAVRQLRLGGHARGRRQHRARPRSTPSAASTSSSTTPASSGTPRSRTWTPDQLNPVLDVHLRGAFYVTQPAWQLMRDQNYGRIVNTSSGAGIFGNFGQTNYGAAKMGLVGLTRVLAVEGAKNNIKANAIAPVAKTRMTEDLLGPLADELLPEIVTPIVGYLAHEACEVSGEVYSVGGGHVARVFLGVAPGYTNKGSALEAVAANIEQIRNPEGYEVPGNLNEELMLTLKALS